MYIKKLVVKNFKRFKDEIFDFNENINIIVGDNESGKSTLLEAIEMCTNYQYRGRPLPSELTIELFNIECVHKYLVGDKARGSLPEILIEAYLDGCPDFRGDHNSLDDDTDGVYVRIFLDPDRVGDYADFAKNPDKISTLPVEFYKIEWMGFHWDRISPYNKKFRCLFIDPKRLHSSFGRARYINSIIDVALDKGSRSMLNLNYRQLKSQFDEETEVVAINDDLDKDNSITSKDLKITADIASNASWESNLQLVVDDIAFSQIGRGEQGQIQIKLALRTGSDGADVVMIEELENHLSHMNLVQLVKYVEEKNQGKQIFLTTHSSYVLNKLSMNNLCLLSDGYTRLKDVDKDTVKTIRRLPGYDTLRVVLSRRTILVEGPSDELVIKKIYLDKYSCLPEENGIDVIVVRGIGFRNHLNIVSHLSHSCHVVKDNDGDHEKNIAQWFSEYEDCEFIKCFSPSDNNQNSLEPALVHENGKSIESLNRFAKIVLSSQTYNKYDENTDLETRAAFLRDWFGSEKSGSKKVDSAIRIFDSDDSISYPPYLKEAVEFE